MSKKDKAKRKRATERKAKGELKRRLLNYSIVAGAALAVASHASGGIVYSGPQDILVNSGNPSVGVDLDGGGAEATIGFQGGNWFTSNTWTTPTAGGYSTHTAGSSYGWVSSQWQTFTSSSGGTSNSLRVTPNAGAAVAGNAGASYAAHFSNSQFIGPPGAAGGAYWATGAKLLANAYNMSWQTGYGGGGAVSNSSGSFLGAKGFIGVRFDNGAGLRYGWIEFEGASDASWGRITGWAYDDAGREIHAGDQGGEPAVPEPGGLALLAMGAAGLSTLRKKRAA